MKLTARHPMRGGGRVLFFLVAIAATPLVAAAAEVLFPKPLHLTRRIDDPLSDAPIVVDEYCAGNQMVVVRGDRVVITNYELQELIEIDRRAGTWSVTRFDEIAKSAPRAPHVRREAAAIAPTSLGVRTGVAGRPIEWFEVNADDVRIELGVDRSVTVGREALDVLLGAAYPNQPSPHHAALTVAADSRLPLEQTVTISADGQDVVLRNVVTRVGDELVPPGLASVPPGATRVESHVSKINRLSAELDRR